MRLIVTGGGTGGHVFPALELARKGRDEGAEVRYFGSFRGQEGAACRAESLDFVGFPSAPLYPLRSLRGWRGLAGLARARIGARRTLKKQLPDVIFSSGGYSSAPVVSAGLALGIPVVMLVLDAVPARSNMLFAKRCATVATTFHASERFLEGCRVVRTGVPVRRELRKIADGPHGRELLPLVLVTGGSQGAQAINEAALGAATRMYGLALNWLHVAGKANFESVFQTYEKLGLKDTYDVKSFLSGEEMGQAYARAAVAVTRGGAGTLSELAAFRLPAVVVPLPSAHAQHQLHNAREFAEMGAATLLVQSELHPATLERELKDWLDDEPRMERAAKALAGWDAPDATEKIWGLMEEAISR